MSCGSSRFVEEPGSLQEPESPEEEGKCDKKSCSCSRRWNRRGGCGLRNRKPEESRIFRASRRTRWNQRGSGSYTKEMGFDQKRSLKAFETTLYPLLRAHCSACHSTDNRTGSGNQAPLTADVNVNLAHEYALGRVNFRDPENFRLVVRMAIDRHNCFEEAAAWRLRKRWPLSSPGVMQLLT